MISAWSTCSVRRAEGAGLAQLREEVVLVGRPNWRMVVPMTRLWKTQNQFLCSDAW